MNWLYPEIVLKMLQQVSHTGTLKKLRSQGITSPAYGVREPHLAELAKEIGTQSHLVMPLWHSQNYEARLLALRIADPDTISQTNWKELVRSLDNRACCDAAAELLAKTQVSGLMLQLWMNSENHWARRCGWLLLADEARNSAFQSNEYFAYFLAEIVDRFSEENSDVAAAMNDALNAIGARNNTLEEIALVATCNLEKRAAQAGS